MNSKEEQTNSEATNLENEMFDRTTERSKLHQ